VATMQEIQAVMTGFPRTLRWDNFSSVQASRQPPRLALTRSTMNMAAGWGAAMVGGAYRVRRLRISVTFDGMGSWVTAAGRAKASLLQHEQGHLDITGLVARDLAGSILDLMLDEVRFTPATAQAEFQRRITELGQQANALLSRLQSNGNIDGLYDQQTQHGDNGAAQSRWDGIFSRAKLGNPQSFRLGLTMAGIL